MREVPVSQLALVEHCRALIREAVPNAREEIRWGMLCYDERGPLFGVAAQKHFVGLYVTATAALAEMTEELAGVDHGKGCLRFKTLKSVPTEQIRRVLAHAAKSNERMCGKGKEGAAP